MSIDGAIWDLVRDHERTGDAAEPRDDQQARRTTDARRDTLVRMLDATIGVLSSTRNLIVVVEEILREQRDQVAAAPATDLENREVTAPRSSRQRIDLTF